MTDEAALSRKLAARGRDHADSDDEDARALLQKRLEVYSRVLLWAFVALRAFEVVLYRAYPGVKPRLYGWILSTGIVGLVAMAACWRGLLVGRTLRFAVLARIDVAYTAFSGAVFGATAVLAYDRHESAYTCLVYTCLLVFTRALVVPSRGSSTAKVSAIAFAPLVAAAAVLAAWTPQEVPGTAYFACATLYSAMAVVIATAGSRFIYGLRRRVRASARLGQYTLEHKIGEGGMGIVYRARHALLRRPTALKLLHPERVGAATLDRFEREVQHMSQLTHPSTACVYDYGHSLNGLFYYAMEFLDGIDLETLVRRHGAQPIGRVIDIVVQICGALHEAHARGLVHRDIKPANIILCERGGQPDVAKVVDFGLARDHAEAAGRTLGTPGYVAPEVVAGAVGPAADLYALGAVSRFLLTGAAGEASADLPAPVRACLARDPAQRPASARALARELSALRDGDAWNTDAARSWWRAFRADEPGAAPAPVTPSVMITVDLDARGRG